MPPLERDFGQLAREGHVPGIVRLVREGDRIFRGRTLPESHRRVAIELAKERIQAGGGLSTPSARRRPVDGLFLQVGFDGKLSAGGTSTTLNLPRRDIAETRGKTMELLRSHLSEEVKNKGIQFP